MLNQAIDTLVKAGIPIVGAAGNGDGYQDACTFSPASATGALVVAALDRNGLPAAFSNVGVCVDIWAPGVAIYAASRNSITDIAQKTGTSQAASFVTGLLAAYLQSGFHSMDVVDALLRDARQVDAVGIYYSSHRVADSEPIRIAAETNPSNAPAQPYDLKEPTRPPSNFLTTASDQPSQLPFDTTSSVPSDVPSSIPSDATSSIPSDVPSDTPSLLPTRNSETNQRASALPSIVGSIDAVGIL